jgi:hypothetical protein
MGVAASQEANRLPFRAQSDNLTAIAWRDVSQLRYAVYISHNQPLLMSVLAFVWVAFFARALVFFRLERAGSRPLYPESWNAAQRRLLERFRLLVGLGSISLWGVFFVIRPLLPTSSSFGYLELLSLIAMLSMSYAWVLLLAPRNLKWLDAFPRSFVLMIAFLVLWWGTAFAAIGWMFVTTASTPTQFIPIGVFA